MRHPRSNLDEALSTALRFSLMAALGDGTEVAFQVLRDALETDDSALSKAMTVLDKAGYIEVRKGFVGNRPRTWLTATPAGQKAFRRHVRALQEIAASAGSVVTQAAGRTATA